MNRRMHTTFKPNEISESTTKRNLAKLLGVSERSVHYYCEFAMNNCAEFASDYPCIGKEIVTSVPLTKYQCWCVWIVSTFIHDLRLPRRLIENHLYNSSWQGKVSRAAYEQFLKVNATGGHSHESSGICTIA